ncbi:MAG: nucleotidyltransferase domain-containing protein [Nanoarchaeota archaeon]|nr:nucleotidyltransferase domain-containing protein [Nanoarchaeota archaeon]MBU0977915.1 nucleotidyltransferase domain-containing protein [Nanoarchaeota archaeon]
MRKRNQNEEIEKLKPKIIRVLKEQRVVRAGIFGSYVRGEQRKDSDIDILIEIDDSLSLLDFIGIKLALETALKRKVDLVEYSAIKPKIRDKILKEEVRIL